MFNQTLAVAFATFMCFMASPSEAHFDRSQLITAGIVAAPDPADAPDAPKWHRDTEKDGEHEIHVHVHTSKDVLKIGNFPIEFYEQLNEQVYVGVVIGTKETGTRQVLLNFPANFFRPGIFGHTKDQMADVDQVVEGMLNTVLLIRSRIGHEVLPMMLVHEPLVDPDIRIRANEETGEEMPMITADFAKNDVGSQVVDNYFGEKEVAPPAE